MGMDDHQVAQRLTPFQCHSFVVQTKPWRIIYPAMNVNNCLPNLRPSTGMSLCSSFCVLRDPWLVLVNTVMSFCVSNGEVSWEGLCSNCCLSYLVQGTLFVIFRAQHLSQGVPAYADLVRAKATVPRDTIKGTLYFKNSKASLQIFYISAILAVLFVCKNWMKTLEQNLRFSVGLWDPLSRNEIKSSGDF
jgi:hypothetical protein